MSELPLDQDAPEDLQIDVDALTAMRSGFLELETPVPVTQIERKVKQALTSGKDFDPLPRQIGRRIKWTIAPAAAAFVLTAGALALWPVPRIPLTAWRVARGAETQRPDVTAINLLYKNPAPLPELTDSDSGYPTRVTGTAAPTWFRKEDRKPVSSSDSGPPDSGVMGYPNIMGYPGSIDGPGSGGSPGIIDAPRIMGGFSGKSGVKKK